LITENKNIAISLQNLTRNFGTFTAVSKVTFDLPYGEIVGFLGPNGAGKSTTMKMIAGLIKPTDGNVFINKNGELVELTKNNKDSLLENLGFLIENPAFYGHMTPRQLLTYFAELKGHSKKEIRSRVEDVVDLVGMSEWIDKKIKTFSKGMRQKIGIASALVHDPEVLVLDEPQTGLDPKARKEMRDVLLKLKEMGKTIFLSSHLLYEVSEISDKIAIINEGHLVAFDTVENLETKIKKSLLQIELLKTPEDVAQKITEITSYIEHLIENGSGTKIVKYNANLDVFEVMFDGSQEKKILILETLQKHGIKVVGFSVPRTNLLENLYIGFMTEEAPAE